MEAATRVEVLDAMTTMAALDALRSAGSQPAGDELKAEIKRSSLRFSQMGVLFDASVYSELVQRANARVAEVAQA